MCLTHWKVIKGGYVMCQKLIRFVVRGYKKSIHSANTEYVDDCRNVRSTTLLILPQAVTSPSNTRSCEF
jgi:hypothetical protein